MRIGTFFVVFIAVLSIVLGVAVYPYMPERVASHWNIHGEADGYMSTFWGVFLLPIILIPIIALFLLIPVIDPLRRNIEKFRAQFDLFISVLVLILFYLYLIIILWNLDVRFNFVQAIVPAFALLSFTIGVLMKHAKRNWFVGIRTPWTLSSDEVWEKTHRRAEWLYKIAAGITLLGVIFPPYAFYFLIVPLVGVSIYAIIFSYVVYRRLT